MARSILGWLIGFHCRSSRTTTRPVRDHAEGQARSLHGKAASVKILDLVKLMPDLKEKGDVSDFLDAGGRVADLEELAGKTANGHSGGRATQARAQGRSISRWHPQADRRHRGAVQDARWRWLCHDQGKRPDRASPSGIQGYRGLVNLRVHGTG